MHSRVELQDFRIQENAVMATTLPRNDQKELPEKSKRRRRWAPILSKIGLDFFNRNRFVKRFQNVNLVQDVFAFLSGFQRTLKVAGTKKLWPN